MVTLSLLASVVAGAPYAAAQARSHDSHDKHGAIASGEPVSTPVGGATVRAGAWTLLGHGFGTLGATRQSGPRGADAEFTTSMASVAATRPVGRGLLTLRLMASGEPVLGRRGYPLLLQTGETADGQNPLRDRQHPHDLLVELAAGYRRTVEADLDGFGYLALIGAPAYGPVPFFHRASGADLPEAPIGHHLHDATHISHGVLTIGIKSRGKVTLEASLFNGREPDQDRWDIDEIRFDSYAFRARLDLGANWSVQGSAAGVAQPERLHPTINQTRLSASASYNRPLSRGNWQTTVAVGRNLSQRRELLLSEAQRIFSPTVLAHYLLITPPRPVPAESLYLVFPTKVHSGWLVESSVALGRSVISGRVERVAKDELFDPLDLRHSQIFSVSKVTVGFFRSVPLAGAVSLGIGAVGNLHLVPGTIESDYGKRPTSGLLYARVDLGRVVH
jgi:hypothetical protein